MLKQDLTTVGRSMWPYHYLSIIEHSIHFFLSLIKPADRLIIPSALPGWKMVLHRSLISSFPLPRFRLKCATSASLVLSTETWDTSGFIRIYLQTSARKYHLWKPLPFIWHLSFNFFILKVIPVLWIFRILLGFVFSEILWENFHLSPCRCHLPSAISSVLELLHLSSVW